MENNTQNRPGYEPCGTGRGNLPACAPLANPYVPFQPSKPQSYQPSKGLIRGTIFPGLDLPFMGMVNTKEKNKTLLQQIQSISFAMNELGLYLDTHQDDAEAVKLYTSYKELYDELMAEFETKYGALTQAESVRDGKFTWLNSPWPWDIAANEEG